MSRGTYGPKRAAQLLGLISLVVLSGAARARAEAEEGFARAREGMDTGGRLLVISEGVAMPHESPHLGAGVIPTERYFSWKVGLLDDHELQYFLGYTPQIQLGSRDARWQANSELDFIGEWTALRTRRMRGELEWWFRWNQTFTTLTTSQFANTQFLTVYTNDGGTDSKGHDVSLATLWWEQDFFDMVGFRIGQLNAQTMWAINEYIGNDRTGFMALPLTGPYGTAFMVNEIGLGLQIGLWSDFAYLTLGLQEATANGQYPDFKSLARGDLAYFAEVGVTPNLGRPYEGAYRVTYSYIGRTGSNPGEEPGHSVVVSARQRFANTWGLFGRYTQSFNRLPQDLFRLAVVAGVVQLQPFGFTSDRVGLAYIYDRPTDSTLRNEHGMEIYWRFQLTQIFSVTPDLQMYFTPSKAVDGDFSTILTLRLQLAI